MRKYIFILITLLITKLGLAQTPNIAFHSCSPETITANEEIELVITLINNGDVATNNNTIVTITSDDQYMTIIDDTAVYGVMSPGETQEGTFKVMLNPMIPANHTTSIDFKASLEGSSVVSSASFDFEKGRQDWTYIDADGDGFDWIESGPKLGVGYGHNGGNCMFSQSYDNYFEILYPDNYLVSPEKYLIGENAQVTFWACAQDMNYPAEHFGLAISSESNTSDSDFTTIAEWTMTAKNQKDQGNWYEYSVDLSEYEGQQLWLAFRHFDCFDEYFLALDDVEIENIYQPMSWIGRINLTSDNPSPNIVVDSYSPATILPGDELNLDVTFINNGPKANLSSSNVVLSTNDQYLTIAERTASLNPMNPEETQTCVFPISVDESTPNGHEAVINMNVKPQNAIGDEISFTYEFEKNLNGWTTIDGNNDGHFWYHTSETDPHDAIMVMSHSGNGHLMSESYCNAVMSPLAPDDYLVAPNLIGATENTTISFWACAQDEDYPSEHFGVAVSTTGNTNAEDFTTIAEWTMTAKETRAGTWYEYTADLSEYAGQFIWVALRHFNSSNLFILCVDDISINNFVRYMEFNSTFNITIGNVSIAENEITSEIYPNPVDDKLYINSKDNIEEIEIYNLLGVKLHSETISQGNENMIDMSGFESGLYLVKIKTDKGTETLKINKN